jgi:hypothetical protein
MPRAKLPLSRIQVYSGRNNTVKVFQFSGIGLYHRPAFMHKGCIGAQFYPCALRLYTSPCIRFIRSSA